MNAQFEDRHLICSDCQSEFIFTAGEQLFFFDKQFKNDPKRCKPCKARRTGLAAVAAGATAPSGSARPETRTECSECNVQTTVPFKPTQGRPVLCRQCFQARASAGQPAGKVPLRSSDSPWGSPSGLTQPEQSSPVAALTELSANAQGAVLSPEAATLAVASMCGALPRSSVASAADLLVASAQDAEPDAEDDTRLPTYAARFQAASAHLVQRACASEAAKA